MEQKSSGSRIGACIALAVLALIAQLACAFIYSLLFTLSAILTFLPEFLVYVLAFAFYPAVLAILFLPLSQFLPWASDCAERICPTRNGLRYTVVIIYDILCVITNTLPCIIGDNSFRFSYLLPLLYAFVFWQIRSNVPKAPVTSSKKISNVKKVESAVNELKSLFPSDCWDIVSNPVLESVHKDSAGLDTFFMNNPSVSPIAWTISAIFTECGDKLSSGHYHIYRGQLNATGIEIRRIYSFLGDELIRRKIADQDYVDNDKQIVSHNILDVG